MRVVRHGLPEEAFFGEEKGDQKSPGAAVAVEEGVDGLEPGMGQAHLDEWRQTWVAVEECFEVRECLRHFVRRRGDERGRAEGGTRRADPVLTRAQFPRRELPAAQPCHQHGVNFADQPHRHRQLGRAREAMVQGTHVVGHFLHVFGRIGMEQLRLGSRQVL
jgi:hypothetical protein